MWFLQSPRLKRETYCRTTFFQTVFSFRRLFSRVCQDLLLEICRYLSHILRPRLHHLNPDDKDLLALQPVEAPLDRFSRPSSSQRAPSPFRQQSGRKGDARFHKKSSGTPQKRGGFSEVGVSSLTGGRRLPSQQLVGLEGSGRGRLGSGGTAGWLSDPLRPSTSSIRASALPAGVLPPHSIRGVALNQELQNLLRKGGSRTSPTVSGFLQPPLPRQEGFGVLAPHHRPVDPERVHHLVTLPHGDSSVSPEFHPSQATG